MGRAIHEGEEREVHVRVAGHEGCIFLDLGDSTWRVVEITPRGWRIIDSTEVPVYFATVVENFLRSAAGR